MQTAVLVLNREEPRITAEAFAAQYMEDWGDALPLAQGDDEDEEYLAEKGMLLFEIEGGMLGVVQQSAPFTAAAGLAEMEFLGAMWPREVPFNAAHPAHISVVCNSKELDAKQASHLVTQVMASLVALADTAHAVIWLSAKHVIEPSLLRTIALDPRVEGRVPLWIGVDIMTTDDGSPAGRTDGMAEYGHPEFEVAEADENARDLATLLLRLASYTVFRTAVAPGQTFGSDSGPRRIIVGDSMFEEDTIVHRVLPARLSGEYPLDLGTLTESMEADRRKCEAAAAVQDAAARIAPTSEAPGGSADHGRPGSTRVSAAEPSRSFWSKLFGR